MNNIMFKKECIPWNKGLKGYKNNNYPKNRKSRIVSEETRLKLRNNALGNKHRLGDHKSQLERNRISESLKKGYREGTIKLNKNHFKKGHEPLYKPPIREKHWFYSGGSKKNNLTKREWDKIRNTILERDNYKCQLCDNILKICIRKDGISTINLHVHHIDSNKFNNVSDNLVTLCISCHTKTHFNNKYAFKKSKLDR